MSEKNTLISIKTIQNRIFSFRGVQIMIDRDLAEMYLVPTKALNQAVKRNEERFPDTFKFQLTDLEKQELVTNCDRFKNLKHSSVNPYAFTEQGVAMLSSVLRSDIAVKVSIQIMQAFVEMRKFLTSYSAIFQRLDRIDLKHLEADQKFERIFKELEKGSISPRQGVFFDGQVFDAYSFVADLVRKAKKNIILIDNYVDDTVLTILSKKRSDVNCTILTKTISRQLKLDAEKFNQQYSGLKIKVFDKSHDRFLIIDNIDVFHLGASLKDLGKKWFAFSKMDKASVTIIESIKELI